MNARKYLAELLGTFLFMMIGYASIAGIRTCATAPTPDLLVVPFAFGLGLLAAIFAFGHISGGHFNPAVTVAMVLDKRTTAVDAVGYIVAQIIGAIGAAAVVIVTVSQDAVEGRHHEARCRHHRHQRADPRDRLHRDLPGRHPDRVQASGSDSPAWRSRSTLVAIHFAIATLTGSSVNPARSIGSALVGGDLSQLWIYLVGPIVGGIIGWGIYRVMRGRPASEPRSA